VLSLNIAKAREKAPARRKLDADKNIKIYKEPKTNKII